MYIHMHIPASTRIPYVQQYINLSGFLRMPFATSSIQLSLQMFSNLPLRVFPDLFFQLFVRAFLGPHLYMQSFLFLVSVQGKVRFMQTYWRGI